MDKKSIQIPNAPSPIGPYSPAIHVGNQLFVSGQIPMNPQTSEIICDSIESATKQVLENIKALIEEAGFDMKNIVKCSIFLTDMNDFSAMNSIYGSYFPNIPPARETIEVSKLPLGARVEISCIAIQ